MATGTWGGAADRHPFKVRISWTSGADTHQIGFHLRATGVTVGSAQDIATEVADWVTDDMRNLLGNDQRVQGIDVTDLVTGEGFSVSPANQFGTTSRNPGNQAPSFLCCTVSMKSGIRRRYGQGRFFFPIIVEDWTSGDILSTTGNTTSLTSSTRPAATSTR